MKKSLPLLLIFVLVAMVSQVFAQAPPGPPPVLLIVREEIKPGMMGAHGRHSAEFVNAFNQLQTPNHRIALVPVAGNENEVMYITGADSFAQIETINKTTDRLLAGANGMMRAKLEALDKEGPVLHSAMRDTLAIYRPELSFNPAVVLPQMRYFSVTTTRVRPGYEAAYADYVQKIVNVARAKAKIDELHIAVFQVVSGAPGGTFLTFRPMKSLAEMDLRSPLRVRAAMTDDQRKDADKAVREAVMSSETNTYAFAPGMSYVDKQFAAADPTFWNTKPTFAAKPKPRKRTPKPAPPPAN